MRLKASGTFELLSVTSIQPPVAFCSRCMYSPKVWISAFWAMLLEMWKLLIVNTFLEMRLEAFDTLELVEGLLGL